MGKLATAATAVAAPEALPAVAGGAAGKGGRPRAADPRVSAPGSTAAQQRQAIEDLKGSRPATPPAGPGHPLIPADGPPPASPGGGPASSPSLSLPGMPAAAATGSGFLLGLFSWALALSYLHYGPAGVRQFLAAKFLNKPGSLS